MQTKTVDVHEAQIHLVELLSLVSAGTEIILTMESTPLARIVPMAGVPAPRVAGLHPGAIWAIAGQQQTNDIQVLPVVLGHVVALQDLPSHHKDPFDRLLIAQANAEAAVLISHDPIFAHYPVKVPW